MSVLLDFWLTHIVTHTAKKSGAHGGAGQAIPCPALFLAAIPFRFGAIMWRIFLHFYGYYIAPLITPPMVSAASRFISAVAWV